MGSFSKKVGFIAAIVLLMVGNMLSMRAFSMDEGDQVKTTDNTNPPDGVWVGYELSSERVVVDTKLEHYGWIGGEFTRLVKVYDVRQCCLLTGRPYVGCSLGVKCSS